LKRPEAITHSRTHAQHHPAGSSSVRVRSACEPSTAVPFMMRFSTLESPTCRSCIRVDRPGVRDVSHREGTMPASPAIQLDHSFRSFVEDTRHAQDVVDVGIRARRHAGRVGRCTGRQHRPPRPSAGHRAARRLPAWRPWRPRSSDHWSSGSRKHFGGLESRDSEGSLARTCQFEFWLQCRRNAGYCRQSGVHKRRQSVACVQGRHR